MTAWQDQPPQTRRQVRMNERGASADAPFGLAPLQTEETPFEAFPGDTIETTDPAGTPESERRFDTSQATDASVSPVTPAPSGGSAPLGRRAQRAAEAAQQQPEADDQAWRPRAFRQRDGGAEGRGQSFSTTDALPTAEQAPAAPSFIAPGDGDAGASFFPSVFDASAPLAPDAPAAQPSAPEPHAEQPAPVESAFAPSAAAPAASDRLLTRRERRALELAAEQQAGTSQPVVFETSAVELPPFDEQPPAFDASQAPQFSAPVAEQAPVQFEVPAQFQEPVQFEAPVQFQEPVQFEAPGQFESAAPAPDSTPIDLPAPFDASAPFPAPVDLPAPMEAAAAVELPAPMLQPEPVLPLIEPSVPFGGPIDWSKVGSPTIDQLSTPGFSLADLPAPGAPFADLPAPSAPLADMPAPLVPAAVLPESLTVPPPASGLFVPGSVAESERGVDRAPEMLATPTGHWTTQEQLDDSSQLADSMPGRDLSVTTGPITSSALVLPSIPQGSDLSAPFSTTGEVLITGSINLPASLGTTGAHPSRYDHSDLDAMIEATDRDDAEGDSAPVRAIRAVSTHTSPRDIIAATQKSGGSRLPMVLAISAGAMMVSVTVLVIVGFVFDTF